MTNQTVYKNITDLLSNRNWKKHETKAKFDVFAPPNNLDFSESYKLFVYNQIENKDFEKTLVKTLDIIAQIYKEDIDELVSIVIEDRQILSLHIHKENIMNARPSIPFFDTLIHKLRELYLMS